ncbi:unnamed protein product [Chrysoparadoxa australica]
MFERFTEKALQVIMLAQEESRRLGHNFVGTEQIFLGLIGEGSGVAFKVLKSMGVTIKDARLEVERLVGRGSGFVAVEIPFTPRAKKILEMAMQQARDFGHSYIGTEHLLLALLEDREGVSNKILQNLGCNLSQVRSEVLAHIGEVVEITLSSSGKKGITDLFLLNEDDEDYRTPTLEEYTSNLTDLAAKGGLDPVIGRKKEIERVIQILSRRRKNNPILIGEPGVGKTAVAEGLAQRIIQQDVPTSLQDKIVIVLDVGLLLAGTKYRGEFEERLKRIVEEIQSSNNIIVVIDEVHTLVGAGAAEGALDAANILKPALARGELQCIGATTIDEYRQHIEKDAALERRFQPINVDEPTIDETFEILKGLRQRYEQHHQVRIKNTALAAAASLGAQYIADRFLPDKAIDLIDEACSRVRLRGHRIPEAALDLDRELRDIIREKDATVRTQDFEKAGELRDLEMELRAQITAIIKSQKLLPKLDEEQPSVTEDDVSIVVAAWTGIPVNKISKNETQKLLDLEDLLHQKVIGQEPAVEAIARAIRRARVGLRNPDRPIASFLFSGPTGVGKTELTKALASFFFGSESTMVRLDMSEYMEKHTVAKLIGSPPGYVGFGEGGQLTEAVRRKPYTVVLFDEVEKAHPDIFNLLLQILEDGRLTDSKGRIVSFKNTILIMTSNLGSHLISNNAEDEDMGFGQASENVDATRYKKLASLVGDELKRFFRPEFLNRIDEIIIFQQLTKNQIGDIATLMINEVIQRVEKQGITLTVTDRVKGKLVEEGFNPTYGARPLRRAVMRLLEDEVASKFLKELPDTDVKIFVDIDEQDKVVIDLIPLPKKIEQPVEDEYGVPIVRKPVLLEPEEHETNDDEIRMKELSFTS